MKEDNKMTTLMKDGKEVVALAAGGVEFYPMNKNADGSISFNGQTYVIGNKLYCDFVPSFYPEQGTGRKFLYTNLSNKLNSDSSLTVQGLIDKGEKIRLVCIIGSSVLASGIVDLSKPDSKGHFNFQWADGSTSTNTYCCASSNIIWADNGGSCTDVFSVWSDAFDKLAHPSYDSILEIFYSDAS